MSRMRAAQVTSERMRNCALDVLHLMVHAREPLLGLAGAARDDQQRHLLGVGAADRVHDVVAAGAIGHARPRRAAACCARSRPPRSPRPARARRSRSRARARARSDGTDRARDRPAGRRRASRRRASGTRPGSRRAPCAASSSDAPSARFTVGSSRSSAHQWSAAITSAMSISPRRTRSGSSRARHQLDHGLLQRPVHHVANALHVLGQEGVHAIPEQRGVRVQAAERTNARPGSRSLRSARVRPPSAGSSPGSTMPPGISSVISREPWRYWRTITTWPSRVSGTTLAQWSASIE